MVPRNSAAARVRLSKDISASFFSLIPKQLLLQNICVTPRTPLGSGKMAPKFIPRVCNPAVLCDTYDGCGSFRVYDIIPCWPYLGIGTRRDIPGMFMCIRNKITGDHARIDIIVKDQILLVKNEKCIGVRVYGRSYQVFIMVPRNYRFRCALYHCCVHGHTARSVPHVYMYKTCPARGVKTVRRCDKFIFFK